MANHPTVGHDEHEPLLPLAPDDDELLQERATPLPKLQLSILLLLQVAELMNLRVVYPFINQLVSELDITGGDPKKVGYYTGLIQSFFYGTEATFAYFWSRTSDRIGRKPVLLTGLAGICISMTCFGLSMTFWGLVFSRCLSGLLDGNMGVIKSMVGEITDSTNMAQGFTLLHVVWPAGSTIAGFFGGSLSCPYDHLPTLFGHKFWKDYPYLLPCLVSALFAAFGFLIALFFLKETVHKSKTDTATSITQITSGTTADAPLPFRNLMTPPVLLIMANYCLISFSTICFISLQPLFYSTPIEFGGLGLDVSTIGMCMGIYALTSGILQVLLIPWIIRTFGPRRLIVIGNFSFLPVFALFPVINQLARAWGVSPAVWACIIFQLSFIVIMDMSFSAIFIYVTSSAPNKRSLGSVNGLMQTTISIVCTFGPAFSTSLFAFSLQSNWLGGYAVYPILMIIPCVGVYFAGRLPREPWKHHSL